MKYGLTREVLEQIRDVFRKNRAVDQVLLYGSRAMGTHRPGSDIDLAISGTALTFSILLDLTIRLDELELLYTFDLQRLDAIKNPDLIDHIQRVGISIYEIQNPQLTDFIVPAV